MIKAFSIFFCIAIFLLFCSCDSILGDGNGVGEGQGPLVPKSYSNLRIPSGRKRRPGAGGYNLPSGVPITTGVETQKGKINDTNDVTPRTVAGGPIFERKPTTEEGLLEQGGNFTQDQLYFDHPGLNNDSYDSDSLPTAVLAVDVAMQIQSIREIDEANQKIIIEIDLTVHWKDYDFMPENNSYSPEEMENITLLLRQYGGEPLSMDEFEKLWKPDIFIERMEKVTKPGLLSSPITIRIIRYASSVIYTTRASVKLDCNMNFQYYPADTQNCILDLRSYQNDDTKMNLRWNPVPGAFLVDTDDDNFDLKLSYVAQRKKRVKDINLDDAVFDVLQIQLSLRRRMSYHIIQTYIPSTFLVFITWLSFLIPEDLIEARIGISMTTLLTLTAMFAAVRENTPIVSYVKAIDIWMVYCIFIVFATLLEFTFFVWLRNYKVSKREKKLQRVVCDMPRPNKDNSGINVVAIPRIDEISSRAAATFERSAKIFNKFAFGFFVLNFLIFNLVYWPWLYVSSAHNQWEVNEELNGNQDNTNNGFLDEV